MIKVSGLRSLSNGLRLQLHGILFQKSIMRLYYNTDNQITKSTGAK